MTWDLQVVSYQSQQGVDDHVLEARIIVHGCIRIASILKADETVFQRSASGMTRGQVVAKWLPRRRLPAHILAPAHCPTRSPASKVHHGRNCKDERCRLITRSTPRDAAIFLLKSRRPPQRPRDCRFASSNKLHEHLRDCSLRSHKRAKLPSTSSKSCASRGSATTGYTSHIKQFKYRVCAIFSQSSHIASDAFLNRYAQSIGHVGSNYRLT